MRILQSFLLDSNLTERKKRIKSQIEGYIPVLEGYRGIACFLVFLTHVYSERFAPDRSFFGEVYAKVLSMGWCGVDAFFVLSGFLITGILLDNKHDSDYFKNFYARRILRIFPLYYFSMFLILFLLHPVFCQDESYRQLERL